MTDIMKEVERLRELDAKRTPGHWYIGDINMDVDSGLLGETAICAKSARHAMGFCSPAVALPFGPTAPEISLCATNAQFIAAAPTMMTAINTLVAEREAMQERIEKLEGSLEDVMVGGNHLAHVLIGRLGGDFAERFPPDMDAESALRQLCVTDEHDVWICWKIIMNAREALTQPTEGKDND